MAETGKAESKRSERRRARLIVAFKIAICVILVGVCAILPLFVNNAIGYVPLASVLFTLVGAYLYLRVLRRGLGFEEGSDLSDCRRGSNIAFFIGLNNNAPLFFYRVKAYFYTTDLFGNISSEVATTLALAPRERRRIDFKARFDHIGNYEAGLEKVIISDFLSLFTYTDINRHRYSVQVTPRVQPIERIEFSNEAFVESFKPVMTILSDSLDYAGVREYRPGDPLKTIHWKLSAHTRATYTRMFEMYTNPGAVIVFDFFAPASDADVLMTMFDAIIETGFSVERYCRVKGLETELLYFDKYGERVRKAAYRTDEIADIVADMPRVSNSTGEADVLSLIADESASIYSQNNIIVCSANLSSELVSVLVECKARRKEPLLFAVVPRSVVGRERDEYAKTLLRLSATDIGYVILSQADDLTGGAYR
jgi:uncharacterized protein (DUF58 family)